MMSPEGAYTGFLFRCSPTPCQAPSKRTSYRPVSDSPLVVLLFGCVAKISPRVLVGWGSPVRRRPLLFQSPALRTSDIVCAVRWYLRFSLSYREVAQLLIERGIRG
jgi:hypothetical protein